MKLGDALQLVPGLGRFNTSLLFGAMHYFDDYSAMLAFLARATADVAYIEFTFSEGEHDTAGGPGGIGPYTRSKSRRTIYMGDRDAVLESVSVGMPDFEVEERTPISPPGRASDREIWRIRRVP